MPRAGCLREAKDFVRPEAWTVGHGAATQGIVFTSRVEARSPYAFPSGMKRSWGHGPGVARAPLGNPGLGYAFPSGMVRPGGWSAQEGRGSWGRLGNSLSSPHRKRSPCRHHTPPDVSPMTSSPSIDHNPCLLRWQSSSSGRGRCDRGTDLPGLPGDYGQPGAPRENADAVGPADGGFGTEDALRMGR